MKPTFLWIRSQSPYLYLFAGIVCSLIVALIFYVQGKYTTSSNLITSTLIIGSLPVWYYLLKDLSKGFFGVDIIAGVALIGTFIIGQHIAGVVILLMLSGGQLFEVYAMRRARKELSLLLSKTPLFAHVKKGDQIQDIPINGVMPEMLVLIKAGEVISVDGVIEEGITTVDESSLTGESIPLQKQQGMSVYAGTENQANVILVRVKKAAHETRFQSIVRLVKQAEESKSPLVRLADTYSLYFTGITFCIALIAWIFSHDITRVVSVLVVATPCPLLLATPIAIISGMSKASKRGIIIKDGGALETLSQVETFVFDKTGTLTLGTPEVVDVIPFGSTTKEQVIHIAASVDQLSTHILARALLFYAKGKKISLAYPKHFKEHFGDGAEGMLGTTLYFLGKKVFIHDTTKLFTKEAESLYKEASSLGRIVIFLADTRRVLGAIVFEDTIRRDSRVLCQELRHEGIRNIIMLTGDKSERAHTVARMLHVNDVIAECLPEDKLEHIKKLQSNGTRVAMVGDGVNDSPALAQADVGIALGTHGQTASSDVADIVILSRSVKRVHEVVHIAKKTIYLAKQGIYIGIGASTVAMIAGAYGYIHPLSGAILQEGIDVVVIINALRLGSILKERK